jgi:hypothetical protein
MMIYVRVLAILAFIVALVWFVKDPKYESALAALVALGVVISSFVARRPREGQNQSVDGASSGIQAGGDVNIKSGNKQDDK